MIQMARKIIDSRPKMADTLQPCSTERVDLLSQSMHREAELASHLHRHHQYAPDVAQMRCSDAGNRCRNRQLNI